MRGGRREGEVDGFLGEDFLMEGGARSQRIDLVELRIVALDVRLVVDGAEELAEIIAGQIGVDDLDRPARQLPAQMAEHLAPHLHRGAPIGAAHIGDAQSLAVVGELHPFDGADDQGNGEIDDVARAGRRLRIIAGALHRHEAGGVALAHVPSWRVSSWRVFSWRVSPWRLPASALAFSRMAGSTATPSRSALLRASRRPMPGT